MGIYKKRFYTAKFLGDTELYERWDGIPHLIIHNKTYIISVEKSNNWKFLVTLYTPDGDVITKIPYNINPKELWEIVEEL